MGIDWDFVELRIRDYLRGDAILSFGTEHVIPDMIEKLNNSLQQRFGESFTITLKTELINKCLEKAIVEFEKFSKQVDQYLSNEAIYVIKDRIEEMIVKLKEVQDNLK